MAKELVRSYTTVEQSRKLTEILPLESADMYYSKHDTIHANTLYGSCNIQDFNIREYIACWSLAALLEWIRNFQPNNQSALFVGKEDGYQYMSSVYLATHEHNNPIDVCYVMILKLHELKLL